MIDNNGQPAKLIASSATFSDDPMTFKAVSTAFELDDALKQLSEWIKNEVDEEATVSVERHGMEVMEVPKEGNGYYKGKKIAEYYYVWRLLIKTGYNTFIGSAYRRPLVERTTLQRVYAWMFSFVEVDGPVIVEESDYMCDSYVPINGYHTPTEHCFTCGRKAEEHPSWVAEAEEDYASAEDNE